MSRPTPTEQRNDALLLIGSLAGISAGLAAAFGGVALALVASVQGENEQALAGMWWAACVLVVGLCGIPLAYWSGRGLFGFPRPAAAMPSLAWAWTALLFPAAIGLGYLAFSEKVAPQLLAPLAQILAAGIPVVVLALVVRRLSPAITPRRAWGQFLIGMWATPAAALVLEAILLIPLGLLVVIGLLASPQGVRLLQLLTENPGPTLEQIAPAELLIGQPWLIAVLLGFAGLLVPLIEEALKTAAVWPFLRRPISRAEAFLGGVLCGAGYALFEALFLPQPGAEWTVTMVSRIGTTIVHAFGAGITSLGLVRAAAERRPILLLPPYLCAVLLHGLWNTTVIVVGIGLVTLPEIADEAVRHQIELWADTVGPLVLLALSLAALVSIIVTARRQRHEGAEAQPSAEGRPFAD